MNPYLPFKQTPQSDFFTQFRQYMLSVYPPESNFASISPFFKEINQLRASLDYSKYQKLIQADSRLSEELEKFLLKYLSMCLLLDKNLKFSRAGLPNSSDRTQMSLNITWQDSLSNTLSSDSSMKFEIINSLYNLAICEIYSGISFLQSFESDDQKQAIKRFRIGLWALKEVKILIANVNAKFSDLSLAHLNLLENLFLGLAYLTLYEFNEKKEISLGYANMASMLMTASKHFQTADMILEQNKNLYPKELFNKLCLMMLFYESYTEGLAGLKMSKHHENLLQDEPKIQHMGYALAYILQGLKKIERINSKDFISNLPGHYQQKLKILREDALKTSKTFENKNNQIYKHKVFPDNELPGPPEADKPIIGPIIPDLFLKPMEEEQFFQNLLSEEIEAENFEIRKIAEDIKKKLIDDNLETTKMLKNQTLALNSSAQSQFGKKEIPENLIKKYEEFEKNGGSNKLKAIHKFLIEKCLESGEIVKRIKGKLNGEKQEYEKYKAQYGNRWNSLPSEVVNFDYLKILDDFCGKFNQAQMTDEQLFMVYKNNKQHIELLENGMNGLLQLIPEKEQFGLNSKMNSNSALKKKSDEIEILMKVIEEDFLLYNEKFGKINWSESIQEAKQKTAIPGQMALYILSPLTPLANKISDEIKILTNLLYNFATEEGGIAKNSNNNSQITSNVFKILSDLTDLIGQIERGTAFYQQLVNHLKNLEEHVDGYVFARKEEFKELLNVLDHVDVKVNPPFNVQEKGQEKKKDNNNEIWFNEELNQFPLGSSVFMPNKGKGGGLLESTVVVNLSDKK